MCSCDGMEMWVCWQWDEVVDVVVMGWRVEVVVIGWRSGCDYERVEKWECAGHSWDST